MSNTRFLEDTLLPAWSRLTPARARVEIPQAIEQATAAVEAICSVQNPTYENTFAALEESSAALMRGWQRLSHLSSVMDSPECREAINELMPAVVMFSSSVTLNPRLYAVLKSAAAQPWVQQLSPVKQRFIHETLADFRESGADLADSAKQRYAELSTELAQLSQKFGENVLDSTNAWEYVTADPAEIAGLPETARETARQDALAKGYGTEEAPQWRFTLQFTSVQPVLTYADCEAMRERVWHAMGTKGTGTFDNAELINQILTLRVEKAALLGYERYSDYVTARRMAGSGTNALNFIDKLHARATQPQSQKSSDAYEPAPQNQAQ